MASEPAEPTTRQHLHDALDEALLAENTKCYHDYAYGSGDAAVAAKAEAHRLIDLLADPAQTTELEPYVAETIRQLNRTLDGMADFAGQQADARREATAERDALSLLLRGMARKLVATRAERVTLERILSKERRRVDAALALIDAGTSTGPYFLSPDATRAVRAALVGDQPPAEATLECPHCRSLIRPASGAITQLDVDTHLAACGPARQFAHECATAALSGVALRDVEEADDAAGDQT